MPEISKTHMGGTMRLGLRRTMFVKKGSKSRLYHNHANIIPFGSRTSPEVLYGNAEYVEERHRHRYEVRASYLTLTSAHLLSGQSQVR